MSYQFTQVEHRDRVAIVRFDRGFHANPLSYDLLAELTKVARSFEGDTHTSAVILTGRADNFSMGADLKEPARTADLGLAEQRELLAAGPRLCAAWEAIEPITIAAIEGWCVGGGVALAVSLDLRVSAADATFYVAEIERGMNMSWGSVPRINNLIGPSRTKRLIVLAEKTDAQTCADWGLVDYIAPTGQAMAMAMERAEHIASLPPVAVRMCKQGIEAAAKPFNRAVSMLDLDQHALARASADYKEGISSFLESRKPKFTGR